MASTDYGALRLRLHRIVESRRIIPPSGVATGTHYPLRCPSIVPREVWASTSRGSRKVLMASSLISPRCMSVLVLVAQPRIISDRRPVTMDSSPFRGPPMRSDLALPSIMGHSDVMKCEARQRKSISLSGHSGNCCLRLVTLVNHSCGSKPSMSVLCMSVLSGRSQWNLCTTISRDVKCCHLNGPDPILITTCCQRRIMKGFSGAAHLSGVINLGKHPLPDASHSSSRCLPLWNVKGCMTAMFNRNSEWLIHSRFPACQSACVADDRNVLLIARSERPPSDKDHNLILMCTRLLLAWQMVFHRSDSRRSGRNLAPEICDPHKLHIQSRMEIAFTPSASQSGSCPACISLVEARTSRH